MAKKPICFDNPFRPGAGHTPPYLAGRDKEKKEFEKLIKQSIILDNMILTGLRGVGKTVLLNTLKPIAMSNNWLWVGTDLSESATISEEKMAIRLLTDLSIVTSNIIIEQKNIPKIGFASKDEKQSISLNYHVLSNIFTATPGLVSDKLKRVLEITWECIKDQSKKGVIFAYDEAQNLADHSGVNEFPLSILLDVFQSIQKQEIPYMLVLTGLPTLFPKLVEARTYSERMFRIVFLDKLKPEDSRDAILKPIQSSSCPMMLDEYSVNTIIEITDGYPYFIQFICREIYDSFIQKIDEGKTPEIPVEEITRKLDTDFFSGRWSKVTDRQRDLLFVTASLKNADEEFSVQEIVDQSKNKLEKPFSGSHVNQMLSSLVNVGLVYKNRHGRYSFAVPLFAGYIRRQTEYQVNF